MSRKCWTMCMSLKMWKLLSDVTFDIRRWRSEIGTDAPGGGAQCHFGGGEGDC